MVPMVDLRPTDLLFREWFGMSGKTYFVVVCVNFVVSREHLKPTSSNSLRLPKIYTKTGDAGERIRDHKRLFKKNHFSI